LIRTNRPWIPKVNSRSIFYFVDILILTKVCIYEKSVALYVFKVNLPFSKVDLSNQMTVEGWLVTGTKSWLCFYLIPSIGLRFCTEIVQRVVPHLNLDFWGRLDQKVLCTMLKIVAINNKLQKPHSPCPVLNEIRYHLIIRALRILFDKVNP
jgi:thiosulfate reductase cytochrome b subunit